VCEKGEDFFKDFDVVCATCCEKDQLLRINEICHKNDILFFAGDVFGFYGTVFADLNTHEYAEYAFRFFPIILITKFSILGRLRKCSRKPWMARQLQRKLKLMKQKLKQ
jgi:hypothetical protein